VTRPTNSDKFVRFNVLAPILQLTVVIVTLRKENVATCRAVNYYIGNHGSRNREKMMRWKWVSVQMTQKRAV